MNRLGNGNLRLSVTAVGPQSDIHVVRVDGVVDTLTSPELDAVLGSLVHQGRFRIVMDMAGAGYVSSAGWGTFISRLREIREGGGDLRLARMVPDVRGIYDLLEFDGILPCYERLESATSAFNGGGDRVSSDESPSSDAVRASAPPLMETPPSPALGDTPPVESAILRLVAEDPFYHLGEIRDRLAELGYHGVGRWAIWQTLRRHRLLSRRRRFRYYRRRHSTTV